MILIIYIGEVIRKIRREKDLSQEYIAEKADISVTTLSLIENNRVIPKCTTCHKIAWALGISPSQLCENTAC